MIVFQDDVMMHLTNYAITKHSADFVRDDETGTKRFVITSHWAAIAISAAVEANGQVDKHILSDLNYNNLDVTTCLVGGFRFLLELDAALFWKC